ncbi:MAG: DoxX family membrane protein [Corynebacterium sp.]|nr:DoxX family membrane protein [Corynebacterium sp.]
MAINNNTNNDAPRPDKASNFDEFDVPAYGSDTDPHDTTAVGNSADLTGTSQLRKSSEPANNSAATEVFQQPQQQPQVPSQSLTSDLGSANLTSGLVASDSTTSKSSIFERPGRAEPTEIIPQQHPQGEQSLVGNDHRQDPLAAEKQTGYENIHIAAAETTSFDDGYGEYNADRDFASPAGASTAATGLTTAGAAGAASTAGAVGVANTYPGADPVATEESRLAEERAAEERALRKQYGRRGTIDFGLLLIRLALAAYLIVAGMRALFGLGGGAGISGLEAEFAGYASASTLAMTIPILQLAAGVFLLLGLLTPLASMVALIATGFMAIHELTQSGAGLDLFAWPDTMWLAIVLFVVNLALQFTGPGLMSLDAALGVKPLSASTRRPLASSWIFFLLGIAALVAIWWYGTGVNPLA